jgi:hypothetical protein
LPACSGGRKGNDRFRGRMGRNRMENRKPTVNVEADWQVRRAALLSRSF